MENIGKYSIVKELGAGATSNVYLAFDTFSKKHVALKLIKPNASGEAASVKAFKKLLQVEVSLVGKLKHPHIVQMLDAVLNDDFCYIVMEYVNGGTLEQYTEPGHLLPFSRVAELMYKCGKALEFADSQGVIHRDIKPANVLLQGESDVKISDFGTAMVEDFDSTLVTAVGSPAYMSPEQITGEALTRQTDIYSLGVMMSRLLTGKLPFSAGSSHAMMFQVVNGDMPSPCDFRPDVPQALDAIVRNATRKNTSERYQSWREFSHDLAVYLNMNDPGASVTYDAEKFDALRATPFFEKFGDAELWEVVALSRWRKVASASVILQEGDVGNAFFILTSGIVKILRSGKIECFLHRGSCFGEMKRLPSSQYRRTTAVEAGTDCVLFEISLDVLAMSSLECRYQFDEAFLHVLLERLDSAHARISKLLGQADHY